MTFTDDDLKRLKVQSQKELPDGVDGDLVLIPNLKALIARLEAAEAMIPILKKGLPETMGGTPDLFYPDYGPKETDSWGVYQDEASMAILAWRKACGG